jgi:hypothetical protein
MKRIYSLYALGMALVLATGLLLSNPPTVFAAVCTARCTYGGNITVSGTQCSCQTTWDVRSPIARGASHKIAQLNRATSLRSRMDRGVKALSEPGCSAASASVLRCGRLQPDPQLDSGNSRCNDL